MGMGMEAPRYGAETPAMQQAQARPGSLPTIIDEKKLKVTILLDIIKITPAPGR